VPEAAGLNKNMYKTHLAMPRQRILATKSATRVLRPAEPSCSTFQKNVPINAASKKIKFSPKLSEKTGLLAAMARLLRLLRFALSFLLQLLINWAAA
jgi:hypothetical protein